MEQSDPESGGDVGEHLIASADTECMLKLLADIAGMESPMRAKRRALMDGLARITDADAWGWIISRAEDGQDTPAIGAFDCGGFSEEQRSRLVQVMQDRAYLPVEYAALNQLRRSCHHFTKTWDQLVSRAEWFGPANQHVIDGLGFEHILYSVRVMDEDGYFSGVSLRRKKGREPFGARERQIAHLITGLVDWMHWDPALARVTREIQPLPPHLRTMLILLVDPRIPLQGVATKLGLQLSTVKGYTKTLYRHFRVDNRGELVGRFLIEGEPSASQQMH